MKYKEFEEFMKDKGFEVENNRYEILVCDDGTIVSSVSKIKTLVMSTNYTSFMVLDYNLRWYVAKMSIALAFTDLEDREEEEKYYLKLKGIDGRRFLNALSDYSEYFIEDKIQVPDGIITQFTQSEIDDMPEFYTHPTVWEKIKVESEEQ